MMYNFLGGGNYKHKNSSVEIQISVKNKVQFVHIQMSQLRLCAEWVCIVRNSCKYLALTNADHQCLLSLQKPTNPVFMMSLNTNHRVCSKFFLHYSSTYHRGMFSRQTKACHLPVTLMECQLKQSTWMYLVVQNHQNHHPRSPNCSTVRTVFLVTCRFVLFIL